MFEAIVGDSSRWQATLNRETRHGRGRETTPYPRAPCFTHYIAESPGAFIDRALGGWRRLNRNVDGILGFAATPTILWRSLLEGQLQVRDEPKAALEE